MALNFPNAPTVGQIHPPSGSPQWVWDGVAWQSLTTNSASLPDAPSDSKTYGRRNALWSQVLPINGGTLTGALTLSGDPLNDPQAATKSYVDKTLSGGAFLPTKGGTLTGGLHFGSATVATAGDLSRHIDLWGGTFGLSISPGRANLVAATAAYTVVSNKDIQRTDANGILIAGTVAATSMSATTSIAAANVNVTDITASGTVSAKSMTADIMAPTTLSATTAFANTIAVSGTAYADMLQATGSRILSFGASDNPSVAVFDSAIGYAGGIWVNTANVLRFGSTTSGAVPATEHGYLASDSIGLTASTISINAGTATVFTGSGTDFVVPGNAWKPGGGAWSSTSDIRLKKDIVPYNAGLPAVCQLEPVSFKYNGLADTPDNGKTYYSLIADDVQPVMPEMVGTRPATIDGVDTDVLTLDTTPLTLALINAIKELRTRIEALEAR